MAIQIQRGCLLLTAITLFGCAADSSPENETDTSGQESSVGTTGKDETSARIVDARVELQKPKVVKVASGLAPGAATNPQGIFGVSSNVMITMLQTQIRLQRELNGGRNPTFDELTQLMRQANAGSVPMPAWQMIGYDETTGELSLLEDKGEKIRRYKARGIPLDEDDKPFDTEGPGN